MTVLVETRESPALDDSRLMAEIQAGSMSALGALYDRYYGRAYRVAWVVCRDDDRAQDAVQDAFLSVWNSRSTYHAQRETAAPWLLTVVRHRAIDIERRDGGHVSRRASDEQVQHFLAAEADDDVCEQAIKNENAARLHASMAMLPDAQEEVITLAFYGQLSHTEIATQLGLPTGTVKGRMRLGLHKLRDSHRAA
jgi:RNA polymerase sigma-70 factor (ECF subfamily)